jgi:hypothetical protein
MNDGTAIEDVGDVLLELARVAAPLLDKRVSKRGMAK